MPGSVTIFKLSPLFHQLVGLYLTLPWIDILPFYILKREDKRWFGFSLYEKNVSRGELPCTSHKWRVYPHLIYLMDTLKRRIL